MASQEIQKRETVSPEVKQEILRAISRGYVNTAEDIAEIFPVSEAEAIELLNDDEFYLQIANGTRAKMRMLYNTKGIDVLERLLDSKESRDNIAAYDRLAKATGGIQEEKSGTNNFNFFNIEDLLEAKEKREKVIDIPKADISRRATRDENSERDNERRFNRVKNSKSKKPQNLPSEEVNGNIFENEEEENGVDEYDIETMFEESEELEFDES